MNVKIISYINDPHDLDLGEITEFAKEASKPGRHVTLIETDIDLCEYGLASIVWEGPEDTPKSVLADIFEGEINGVV